MQVLKEKTRQTINESAMRLFRAYGYKGVSMRQIAKEANMTVGNIYRYYKNKDELFETILLPTLEVIEELVSEDFIHKIFDEGKQNHDFNQQMIHLFLDIHKAHTDELYILVHGCAGSNLGNVVEKVADLLAEKLLIIIGFYNKNNDYIDAKFLSNMISRSIINSYIEILYTFDDDIVRQHHMLQVTKVYTGAYMSEIYKDRSEV